MAITTSWNYTAASTTKSLAIPDLDWSNFSEMDKSSKTEKWIENNSSPIDIMETMRFKVTNIGNVYNGTNILPSYYALSKAGREVFFQLNDILTASDSANPTFRQDLPFSGHVALKFPTNSLVTGDQLLAFYERMLSMAFATGVVTKSRLEAMMRGSTLPSNLG